VLRQRLQRQPERGIAAALARDEVRGEVAGGPARAERGSVRADLFEQVRERAAFEGSDGSHQSMVCAPAVRL